MTSRLDTVANVAIVIVSALLAYVLVTKHLFPPPPAPSPHGLESGEPISIQAINWAASRRTLLLALKPGCQFYSESAPFYRALIADASANQVNVIVMSHQEESAVRSYTSALALPVADVRQVDLRKLGIRAVPTVVVVGPDGRVIQSWQGRLPKHAEEQVRSLVTLN